MVYCIIFALWNNMWTPRFEISMWRYIIMEKQIFLWIPVNHDLHIINYSDFLPGYSCQTINTCWLDWRCSAHWLWVVFWWYYPNTQSEVKNELTTVISETAIGYFTFSMVSDSKVYGANMGPTWGRQDPGGPHVGPMNFAIWSYLLSRCAQWGFANYPGALHWRAIIHL